MADKKKAKPMTPRIEVFDGLTVEEARFCAGYVAHGDRTRALKESGYGFNSDMSAYDRARQLLAKPSVQKELKRQTRLLKPETFLSDTERTELSKARDAMGERSEGLYREKLHLQNGLTIR